MWLSCYVPSQIILKSRIVHLADKQILKRHIRSYPKIIVSKKSPGEAGEGGGGWYLAHGLYVGSFSYTSVLASLCVSFSLHFPCWLVHVGSLSYTSCAGCLCREFLIHILCLVLYVGNFSYTSCAGFFVRGISLTHPVLASLCGEFLLHIPCWSLYVAYFSYISMLASLCW